MDLKNFLKGLPAFSRFADRPLDALAASLQVNEYPAGHRLLTQGEQGSAVYILMSGSVKIDRYDAIEGTTVDLAEALDGEVVGLVSLVENMPVQVNVTTAGRVVAAVLTPDKFHALFLLAPTIGLQLEYMVAVQLSRNLQEQNRQLRKGLAQRKSPPSLIERLLGSSR
jgi:CRP/FNR family transcriptional regulator, cyclic AMP receptor protein